VFIYIIMKSEK